MTDNSPFLAARRAYQPRQPRVLADLTRVAVRADAAAAPAPAPALAAHFPRTANLRLLRVSPGAEPRRRELPLRVGVVLSGGPAPGGHNVLWGLLDGLAELSGSDSLVGFLGGPGGILTDTARILTRAELELYRNTGGFDAIGTGRTKLTTEADFAACRRVLETRELDALVVVGGDDSNTNAAVLAEYLAEKGSPVRVVGVPKTIDGDLKNEHVEASFGFDTAAKVYAELIANIARDALSTRKYYHFIRLMGRSASHVTLEAALATRPNLAIISEEVAQRGLTLRALVAEIGDLVKARSRAGKDFGIILVPEGLIEFIPEMKGLINELNTALASHDVDAVPAQLSPAARDTFASLPAEIQEELLLERDPHGNVVVSLIDTEKLLIELVKAHLAAEKKAGRYGGKFGHQHHFLGYEGRCAAPSNFDADYAFALGRTAAALVGAGASGYMAVVSRLAGPRADWQACGAPLTGMMALEERGGKIRPVIHKSLITVEDRSFKAFAAARAAWARGEEYRFAGPVQYFGPEALTDAPPFTLVLDQQRP